jgi:uncharacterized membrane protein YgcG
MKKCFLLSVVAMSLISLPALAQSSKDTASLGLPGDNLDLYAVMDLFLKSKTIEGFEKSLNDTKSGINNLDLNLDKKIDFIKVVTEKKGESYLFTLQVPVSEKENQDVAVILVDKDKDKKVTVQIVGDPDLYGKDYVIEPKTSPTPAVTANPAYTGAEPAKDVPASTTTVVVQSAPIVQYVYSPAYVPYYPPYYYGYYPPYFAMAATIAIGVYRHNNYYHHGGYYGGHYHGGNTVVINNRNNYVSHYNNNRNTSARVSDNMARGDYGNRNGTNRPSTGGPSGGANRPNNGPSASTRPSNTGPSGGNRASQQPSASNRQSGSMNDGRSRSSGGSYGGGGGGYSGGGGSSRGGGGFSGGGSRGGGGGGRRR